MSVWKVIIDYDGGRPLEEQDTIDAEIDRLAREVGTLVDGGRGAGFGRRDLDFSYETEEEAAALMDAVRRAFVGRSDLDLSARCVAIERELDD